MTVGCCSVIDWHLAQRCPQREQKHALHKNGKHTQGSFYLSVGCSAWSQKISIKNVHSFLAQAPNAVGVTLTFSFCHRVSESVSDQY